MIEVTRQPLSSRALARRLYGPSALRVAEEDLKRILYKGRAEMIRKVYEVDPMVCPKCGGRGKRGIFLSFHDHREREPIVS